MIPRRQLPVSSPIEAAALARALVRASAATLHPSRRPSSVHAAVSRLLEHTFDASHVTLTSSGTSALVTALRLAGPPGATVAFPGYACIDLAAAARRAGVRVRLYDIDPGTLSPDLDSLDAALRRGVQAVLVVHLYGHAANIPSVRALAANAGAVVIEDAAQAAGGTLHRRRLGSFGDLSVLSFGRGKGTTGGNGGALLSFTPEWTKRTEQASDALPGAVAGWRDLAAAAAQWMLGRPALYALPAAIPGLRLGEMVYHPAHEPEALSVAAAALVERALEIDGREVSARQSNAASLATVIRWDESLVAIRPLGGSVPGYLRFPVLDSAGRGQRPVLGAMRGYPLTLLEQPELSPCLMPSEPPTPGATELREKLMTLPTHSMVSSDDITAVSRWLADSPSRSRHSTPPTRAG